MRYVDKKNPVELRKLHDIISGTMPEVDTVIDIMAGCGTIGDYFKDYYRVVANDPHIHAYNLNVSLLTNRSPNLFQNIIAHCDDINSVEELEESFNMLEPVEGFFAKNYSTKYPHGLCYYKYENACKIDAVLEIIDSIAHLLDPLELIILKVSLMESADLISNTATSSDYKFKELSQQALYDFKFKIHLKYKNEDLKFNNLVFNVTAEEFIREDIGIDYNKSVLILDPPTVAKHYSKMYHLAETIMYNDNPELVGKCGIRKSSWESDLSRKSSVLTSLAYIINHSKTKHVILMYPSSGLVSLGELKEMLQNTKYKNIQQFKYVKKKTKRQYLFVLSKKENVFVLSK